MAKTLNSDRVSQEQFATLSGPSKDGLDEVVAASMVDPALVADLNTKGVDFVVLPKKVADDITAARQAALNRHPLAPLAEGLGAPLRVPGPLPSGSPEYSILTLQARPVNEGPSPLITATAALVRRVSASKFGDLLRRADTWLSGLEDTSKRAKLRAIHPLLDSGLGTQTSRLEKLIPD